MKKRLTQLLLLLMAAGSVSEARAQQAYAVLNYDEQSLNFYCKSNVEVSGSAAYELFLIDLDQTGTPEWCMYANNIQQVNIDASFADCHGLTSTKNMFRGLYYAMFIAGLKYLDTKNVTDMSGMFADCVGLCDLDLSYFDIGKVTNMSEMFSGCSMLTQIYTNLDWNHAGLASANMFQGCTSLEGAVAFDASQVTAAMANPTTGYFTSSSHGLQVATDEMVITPTHYDVNGDGKVTIADLTYLADVLVGHTKRPVTAFSLSASTLEILAGNTAKLEGTFTPADADCQSLSWTSSDVGVARISASGLLKAVAAGTCAVTATTLDGSGLSATCTVTVTAPGYVDLGLPSGTLWATCNIGANSPEEYGDYFAWAETSGYNGGKTDFSWSTYTYGTDKTLTKYNNDSSLGTVDDKTELDLADDAAYVNWGPNWRMPSNIQFNELINSKNTTTQWTMENGVYGRKITSKKNSNSIFLPATGYHEDSSHIGVSSDGHYWSRSLGGVQPYWAYSLSFSEYGIGTNQYTTSRSLGYSIRPVRNQ